MLSRIRALVESFVPSSLDVDGRRSARMVALAALGIVSMSIPLGVVDYLHVGSVSPTVLTFAIGSLLMLANPFLLRSTGRVQLIASLLMIELAGCLAIMAAFNGGLASPALLWAIALPLIAHHVQGKTAGLIWGAVVIVLASAFYAAEQLGVVFPSPLSAGQIDWWRAVGLVSCTGFVAVLGWLHASEREHAAVEQARMRRQLATADKMSSLGVLAAGVAHEINNPLAYVAGNLSFVKQSVRNHPDVGPHVLAALRETLDGTRRIREIVSDLKMFTRSDDTEPKPLSVLAAVGTAVRMAASETRNRAVVTTELDGPGWALANEARLTQVLLNLVVNAAHAIPHGRVSGNMIRIVCREQAGRAIIEVHDTGSGISEKDVGRIFDAFFTTKGTTGTGLGLAICRELITEMSGQLTVTTTESVGSCFRVSLPAAQPPRAALQRRATTGPTEEEVAHSARVLVIDDESGIRNLLARVLQHHNVTVAKDGQTGIDLCQSDDFDVIFCDLMMPDVTGIELYNELGRANRELQEKVVFMTGGACTEAAREFLQGVPNRALEKPFNISELRGLVDDITDP